MNLTSLPRTVLIALGIHTVLFVLVVSGLLPRSVVLYWTLALLVWAGITSAQYSVLFFIAAIPLFIAIPITPEYDNLTMWRPLSIVMFLRWFLSAYDRRDLLDAMTRSVRSLRHLPKRYPVASSLALLGITAVLSLLVAPDIGLGIRRIILFTNAALVPLVLADLLRRNLLDRTHALRAIVFSFIAITVVAVLQVVSTYFIDIYQFMRIWGEGIQLRQFGTLWSQIAIYLGNTWFAYYGPQLSLRVFSLFPDSHSFPIYIILSLSALMAFSVRTLLGRAGEQARFMQLMRTRANLGIVWIPLGLLMMILSGTRGIWAAAGGLIIVAAVIWYWLRSARFLRPLWLWIASFIGVTALLFAVAYPISVSPQFLLAKGDLDLFSRRIRSILDLNETSNRQRLAIWSATVDSIKERPLLGVGIGNYPVVLDQRLFLARAGSTAHNIYLHIAAEMGIVALGAWLWLWLAWYRRTYVQFVQINDALWRGYYGWMLLAIPWVAAYLLTDAALFDERTLLLFGISLAVTQIPHTHHDA